MSKLYILFFFLLFTVTFYAQEAIQNDTIVKGSEVGKLKGQDAKSIIEAYEYDPKTNTYIYKKSIDGFSIQYPIILTPDEYQKLIIKQSMHDYYAQKLSALDGKKEGSEEDKKDLLPRYYVKSGFFESLFGSNTIDVKPTGSIEVDLGIRYTKQDNPAFSPRNRSNLTFDFDQRISLGLKGMVGTRLGVNMNYDTQSTFAFQNLLKLEYTPSEDDIVQKVEVGNVSMPLNSTLIRGAQSLFGVKTELQFGKTRITGVFSEQKSQTKSVVVEGGGTVQTFDVFALDYDNDRHYFLSQYFRDKYDKALANYPFIDSRVQITRIEVWVTNKQNRVNTTSNNLRNIIALQDLGESQLTNLTDNEVVFQSNISGFFLNSIDSPSDNSNNQFDPALIASSSGYLTSNIREIVTSNSGFTFTASEGGDYAKLENARKLTANEFTYNAQLGYISLQQRLSNDEVLAVAYQYTIGDELYQVGEFANDGVEATVVGTDTNDQTTVTTQCLLLKMLKSNLINVNQPIWNLMMKNIYQIPGAYQLEQNDFRFNIVYNDATTLNYITSVEGSTFPPSPTTGNEVQDTPLLNVFNLDKLDYNQNSQSKGDGFFDFIQGTTIDALNGRIIFTTKEPFGELIFNKLQLSTAEDYKDSSTYNPNQSKYVFANMYSQTQATALQDSDKNKFLLKGRFKTTGNNGISIGAFNVPQGSVVVTAGGRVLVEGIDYSVNYQAGRLQILDPSLQSSNIPINISVENNSVFGQQTTRFMGLNVEHKFSDDFMIGASYLRLTERPFTQKSTYGQESVNNTIYGVNGNYATEVPFLTRLVNKLPNMDTDVPSNLAVRGEVAFLKPGTPKYDNFEGETTIYVDDFEGSQSTIDLRSFGSWNLSSTPYLNSISDNTFNASDFDNLSYGYKRAKLAWYTVDPTFYVNYPAGIGADEVSQNATRRVFIQELFPDRQVATGETQVINTLNLSYFPSERGPYNNNPSFGVNPESNFGGITRALTTTNFQQSNIEYIQFWVLDPYVGNSATLGTNTGKIYFNLGEISEDILSDGRKQYENGLGDGAVLASPSPVWGDVPASQSLIYAFDTDTNNRAKQDVGLDGLADEAESVIYSNYASAADPAADNYTYFLNATGDIINRYKDFNGLDGNSAVDINDSNTASSALPDKEDVNNDNTMNTINAYYEYSIDVRPNMNIGENYITDVKETTVDLPNGRTTEARWLQYKIPLAQYENIVGSITDFTSIRFMRTYMTGFSSPITIRFGTLDLVRGEWRQYEDTLQSSDEVPDDDGTTFDVLSVNLQENSSKCPVPYVIPPSVQLEQLVNNNTVVNQNEQSLALRVSGSGLEPGDSRAVFKYINIDMRQYKKLKMFLHAEQISNTDVLDDNELVGFIRFGTDFTENFYQIEVPLKVTKSTTCQTLSNELVWPSENDIDLQLNLLTKMKVGVPDGAATTNGIYYPDDDLINNPNGDSDDKLRLGIKGSPDYGVIRNLMVGIKNYSDRNINGEVWFNELRLASLQNQGGMAALLNVDANFADLATISGTARISTIGFGSLEQGATERSTSNDKQYSLVTNVNVGKLLPKKWKINLPVNYSISEQVITPQFDPFNRDIQLNDVLNSDISQQDKDQLLNQAITYNKQTSLNFIGVKKQRGEDQKSRFYNPENLTFSQTINKIDRHDPEIEEYIDQQVATSIDYTYGFNAKPIEPFKNVKSLNSNYFKLLKDFNFNLLPTNINFNAKFNRQYNKQTFRQFDVVGISTPLYRRNFAFNYQFGMNFNLTKSLKLNYSAFSNNVVLNYLNDDNSVKDDFDIWQDYFNTGNTFNHNQKLTANYELPINKIPFLSFIKSSYVFDSNFNWQQAATSLSDVEIEGVSYNLGNTIQNSQSNSLNTTLNMEMFYKYVGLTGKNTKKKTKATPPKPGEKIVKKGNNNPVKTNSFVDGLKGVLTAVKNIQINYTDNRGTVLPGYLPGVGFWGTTKPSLGFIFGSQNDIRYEAAKNGYLTNYQDFNQNFTQVSTQILKATAKVTPLTDFQIDVTADRSYSSNYSEQYDVSSDGFYNSRSPYSTGQFSVSAFLLKTAFSQSDENSSDAFDAFRNNRLVVAQRLATQRGDDLSIVDAEGFPIHFNKNNQDVLLPSFLAAYTGADASTSELGIFRNFPMPNWTARYTGLMKLESFKKKFKRFSLQHGYRASYTVNEFRSNLNYTNEVDGDLDDETQRNISKTLISNINLVEQFNPLMKIDFELKNSFRFLTEFKRDRALSLSFDNNLLTEVKGFEYSMGFGYRIKDVRMTSSLADNPTGLLKGDVNLKADFSYRNNKTIVRYLDYDNNQLAAGQNIWTFKLTADYSFSKYLTAIFYYDHSFSSAVISTTFPLTNIRSGFTIRYTFGN